MKHREGARSLREAAPGTPTSRAGDGSGPGRADRSGAEDPREAPSAPAARTPPAPSIEPEAEWWLVVAMKEPVGASREGYEDTGYPDHSDMPGYHVGAFGRDYENPWLVRAMVALGLRCTNKGELAAMAERVIAAADGRGDAGAPSEASPDVGAALCVLGYRLLDSGAVTIAQADALLARLAAYEAAVGRAAAGASPHARRWVISNAYMAGQVELAVGRRAPARAAFQRCAGMDVLAFSPLLASKTIDASYHAGLIAACDGDLDGAVADFRRGLAELVRVLGAADWTNILGSIEEPLTFGLVDLQQGVEFASRCAFGVASAGLLRDRPGFAWTLLRRRAMADLRRWSDQQTGAIEWLRQQRRELDAALTDSRAWIAQQEQGRAWLGQQAAMLAARVETLSRETADERDRLRGVVGEQKRAGEWLATQKRELEEKLRERDATIVQLRGFVESQKAGEQWLIARRRELEERVTQRDAWIVELQAKIAKLIEGRGWLLKRANVPAPSEEPITRAESPQAARPTQDPG